MTDTTVPSSPPPGTPEVLARLDAAVARLRSNPMTPSMSLRTPEGDVWSIGDGRPVVSGSRADLLEWLTTGATGGLTPRHHLPTVPKTSPCEVAPSSPGRTPQRPSPRSMETPS